LPRSWGEGSAAAMTLEPVQTEAPGKIILLGEHAVVYGELAVGFPLARTIRVDVAPGSGHIRLESAPDVDIPLSGRAASPRELVHRGLGRWLQKVDVRITFGFPPMSGLGSSAAIAVALAKARHRLEGRRRIGFAAALKAALATERIAHAKPSGLDPAICLADAPITFRRDGAKMVVRRLRPSRGLYFVVGAVGAHGGTRHVVSRVAELKAESPPLVRAALATLGEASKLGARGLERGETQPLGTAMNLAHGVLAGLGLVSSGVANAIQIARQTGAIGAKMSGAGGNGGAFLALYATRRAAESARDELRLGGVPCWVERLRPAAGA
jgi:mevalonate kinase